MPSPELVQEVGRQMTVCNACRYCEGYCAVFPAMELRRTFSEEDVIHLANLCFDCRACYNACPFTPPHEYAINVPKVMADVRLETYREYSSPRLLSRLFSGNPWLVWLTVALCVVIVFGSVLVLQGGEALFGEPAAEEAFYRVVPYTAMVLPAMVLSGFWLAVLGVGAVRFWRRTSGGPGPMFDLRAFLRASKDAFGLEYLKGGGDGCDYPGPVKSMSRAVMHHLVVGGVLLAFASTTTAAFYHNVLGQSSPYPYFSPPVVLGTVGGVFIVAGGLGLAWLKRRAADEPASPEMLRLDVVFLWLLIITSVSGLVLLALRHTAAMGSLLTLHLGIVAALYLALPYSKFAHVVYRYAALVRHHIETEREAR